MRIATKMIRLASAPFMAALLLSACGTARPYDPAQVPAAQQQRTADVEDCLSKSRLAYRVPSDLVRCLVLTEVRFARAIHVSDPRMVEAFRWQMMDIGRRANAHRISWAEMARFMGEAEKNFETNLIEAYRQDDARRRARAGEPAPAQPVATAASDCTPSKYPAGSMAAALDPNACH